MPSPKVPGVRGGTHSCPVHGAGPLAGPCPPSPRAGRGWEQRATKRQVLGCKANLEHGVQEAENTGVKHNLRARSPRVTAHCTLQRRAGNRKEGANHEQKLVAG